MAQITAKAADLGKAMSVASLASGDNQEKITSHALFSTSDGLATIRATDGDRIAFSTIPVEGKDTMSFTVDPKNVAALLKTADKDTVTLKYDDATKTLNLYASDDEDAYVSLVSFDPAVFPVYDDMLKGAVDIGDVSSAMLDTAFRFQLGFVAADDKNAKFANLYIADGVMYGSNGSTKIGAFKSDDFAKMTSLVIRRSMLPGILALADKLSLDKVFVKETEKLVLFFSGTGEAGFGFKKSVIEMPKMPLSTKTPEGIGISVERAALMKKISRLSIGMKGDRMNVEVEVNGDTMTMKTVADRKSVEKMQCKRLTDAEHLKFLMECKLTEGTLALFKAPSVDLYFGKNRCTMYSAVDGSEKEKASVSVAMLSLPREV